MHRVHEIPTGDVSLQYKEVTREECHQYCTESLCNSYAFCNNEHFGSCYLYSITINNTVPDQSCDSFVKYNYNVFPGK